MNEDHARRVAEIEALAADYTEPAGDPLPFKLPPETIERLKSKWAFDWQRIVNAVQWVDGTPQICRIVNDAWQPVT